MMTDHLLELLADILTQCPGDEGQQVKAADKNQKIAVLQYSPVCNLSGNNSPVPKETIPATEHLPRKM